MDTRFRNALLLWGAALLVLTLGCSSVPTFGPKAIPSTVRLTDEKGWIVLRPAAGQARDLGLLFYPGGLVNAMAYAKTLAPLAAEGWVVAIPRMPLDLAFFDVDRGLQVGKAAPGPHRWIIGGHSLGGVAASLAVHKHPGLYAGIFFWASYPSVGGGDLSKLSIPSLTVTGSADGLATPAKVQAGAPYLPPGAQAVVIQGGNHAQFADYGPQKGDHPAGISRVDQQRQVQDAMRAFLGSF